jgi:hypothetical protein
VTRNALAVRSSDASVTATVASCWPSRHFSRPVSSVCDSPERPMTLVTTARSAVKETALARSQRPQISSNRRPSDPERLRSPVSSALVAHGTARSQERRDCRSGVKPRHPAYLVIVRLREVSSVGYVPALKTRPSVDRQLWPWQESLAPSRSYWFKGGPYALRHG